MDSKQNLYHLKSINNMKYLKLFENFDQTKIDAICKKYGIWNYTINTDGSIDVNTDVLLYRRNLTKLPLKFNRVSGSFHCQDNLLTNLDGYPKEIGGFSFYDHNPITQIIDLFVNADTYIEYQETYNFVRKDCKIVKHLLEEALKDYNEYYNKNKKLPQEIKGYTYI
jgi:hypothetical protein